MLQILAELSSYRKSYRAGLLQAKAFRVFKKRTNDVLAPHHINATDWGILGLLVDTVGGISPSEIAMQVGVKSPYITRSLAELEKQSYITVTPHPFDSRAKLVSITTTGRKFVAAVENEVVTMLQETFAGISHRDRLGYVKTLIAITKRYGDETITDADLDHRQ